MDKSEKPPGTTVEGMVWNANYVLEQALNPSTKKSADVLKGARGVIIVEAVQVGLVFASTRGSGVVLAKNEAGEWSAPSAVTLTSFNLGLIAEASDQGILIVFQEDKDVNLFLTGTSIEIGAGVQTNFDTPMGRDDLGAVYQFVTNKGPGSCRAYIYKRPNNWQGMSLQQITFAHQTVANERFYGYGKGYDKPFNIVRKGEVSIPEDSGIPDLHKKLIALEAGEKLEISPEMEEKKEKLRKEAVSRSVKAKEDLKDEIEEVAAGLKDGAKEELKENVAGDLKD